MAPRSPLIHCGGTIGGKARTPGEGCLLCGIIGDKFQLSAVSLPEMCVSCFSSEVYERIVVVNQSADTVCVCLDTTSTVYQN